MSRHICENKYAGDGARGTCFFTIEDSERDGYASLEVGWSCVVVHNKRDVPISWLAELIAIATGHDGGIAGFLKSHRYGSSEGSYALECDPET